jgi:hypothetical protein
MTRVRTCLYPYINGFILSMPGEVSEDKTFMSWVTVKPMVEDRDFSSSIYPNYAQDRLAALRRA